MTATYHIKKYEFKTGLPHELEIIPLNEFFKKEKPLLTLPHRTGFYHILWFQKGSPTHLVDFNPIKIEPNSILFLSKDTVQRFDQKGNFEGKAILFTDSFFCKTEKDTKFLKSTVLFHDLFSVSQIQLANDNDAIPTLFQQIEIELKSKKDKFQSDILQNLLHNLLLHSERERRRQGFKEIERSADLEYVMLFKDLLEIHYKGQKQVNYFIRQLSVTEKRLNQATKTVLGKTPKQIIDDRIVLEAKRLLAHTTESIKEIGYSLGFEEPTNFIKYFRKHHNCTPVEFRERLQL